MGLTSRVVMTSVILLAILMNLPPPPLSPALQAWRERGRYFSFKEHDIFYIDETGVGKDSVICLHGFPTSSYDWLKVLPGLKQQFARVILLDFLGFGFTDKPVSHPYRIAEQADIVEALSQHRSLPAVHLLSHDYGDTVALELLARHNKLTSSGENPGVHIISLMLLNGGIFLETHHPRPIQKLLSYPVVGPLAARLTFYHLFRHGFAAVFGQVPTEEELTDFYAAICYKDGHIALADIIDFLRERREFRDRYVGALQTTAVPVLMVYGPADPVNPPAFAGHFRRVVPQHTLVELASNVGHYPQWEDHQSVVAAISDFMGTL